MPLFPFDKQLHFELFVIELLPSCEHLSPPHATGVIEHVIVIQGKIEVFANNVWHPLNKGEGFRFNANQPHGYRNVGKRTACIHDMIHYPKALISEDDVKKAHDRFKKDHTDGNRILKNE